MKLLLNIALTATFSAVVATPANAEFNDAGTDYTDQEVSSYVDSGPAGETLAMVDFLLCVLDKSKAVDNPDSTYSVLTDEVDCNGEKSPTPQYATQTLTTSGTVNPTAEVPFVMDSWFVTAEGMRAVAKASVTSWVTNEHPNGVFTMDWKAVFPPSLVGMKGSLKFNADNTMHYIENNTEDGETFELSYVHGTLSADGSTGSLRIKGTNYDSDGNKITPLYRYVFDESHLHYDTDSSAAMCYDRSANNETTRVFGYQLFDSAGDKVSMSGPFGFTYSSGSLQGWASPHGAWLEGGEDYGSRPSIITRSSNSKEYDICYDDDWESNLFDGNGDWERTQYDNGKDDNVAGNATVCTEADDNIKLGLVDRSNNQPYIFDAEKVFDSVTFVDRAKGGDPVDMVLRYDGYGSSLSLPWECLLPAGVSSDEWIDDTWAESGRACDAAVDFRPKFNVPDGTLLTQGSDTYYLKAIDTRRYLKKESNVTPCADISVATAPADASYTADSIPDVNLLWSALPTVTEENTIKYIHGVAQ